jgi:hypothetical protein
MEDGTDQASAAGLPDGIAAEHVRPAGGWRRRASPLSLLALVAIVALGLSGLAGRERAWVAEGAAVELSVHASELIRSGEIFETRITVSATEAIAELVIGVDISLWRDMTVNTMIPAAADERSEAGRFLFSFGALEPGETFELKVDLQVNPDALGNNPGAVRILDGERELASVEVGIGVLP